MSVTSAKLSKTASGWQVEAEITNHGGTVTQDVVQVYCQNEGSANAPANPRLCAFKRVNCPAGEAVKVTLDVPAARLLVVNESGESVMEGRPVFYVGMGQPDSRTEALTGHSAIRLD